MDAAVLILRPQPGADATAAQARALGLEPVVAPLFSVRPVGWEPPEPSHYDAVMMTSANAARHAGSALAAFLHLPCYAVGEVTAAAAADAGFAQVVSGPSDAKALVERMADDGIGRALHLCGADRIQGHDERIGIEERVVYAVDAASALSARAREAIEAGALVLLHSPRAAAVFAALCDEAGLDRRRISLAAISEAAVRAAGPGWARALQAPEPRGQALLEVAAKLCETARPTGQRPSR